ncbi:MAG: hypothetical protein ACO3RV_00415 [Luteolibacter sp.]
MDQESGDQALQGPSALPRYTADGVLFAALGALLLAMWRTALAFRTAFIVGVAALLPGGSFFAERQLKRHQQSITE